MNPEIFIWARETAGFSLEEAKKKLDISSLLEIEEGKRPPSRAMLAKMAEHYKRPLVLFYMESLPKSDDMGEDFRTLPHQTTPRENAIVATILRDVRARQSIVKSLLEEIEEAETLDVVEAGNVADGIEATVKEITTRLSIDNSQIARLGSKDELFRYIREKVENSGIFTIILGDAGSHHTAVGVDLFRGYCIADNIAPFIVINGRDSDAAKSFTLLHEFVHLWIGKSGVSNYDYNGTVEKFCNEVAAEILLPRRNLEKYEITDSENARDIISSISSQHNVSSSMVAYRFYLMNKISHDTWQQLSSFYRQKWEENRKKKEKKGGPDHYTVKRNHLGNKLCSLARRTLYGGNLSVYKAGIMLGANLNSVYKIVDKG